MNQNRIEPFLKCWNQDFYFKGPNAQLEWRIKELIDVTYILNVQINTWGGKISIYNLSEVATFKC